MLYYNPHKQLFQLLDEIILVVLFISTQVALYCTLLCFTTFCCLFFQRYF